MQEDRVYDNLLNLPLFLGMSRNDLLEVAGHTKFDFQKADKGLTIVKEGEPCKRLYFLLTGELNVVTEADDHGYRIEEGIKAPEAFQMECIYGYNQYFTHTYIAKKECSVMSISKQEMQKLSDRYEIFRINMFNLISTQTQKNNRRLYRVPPKTLSERIIQFFESRCLKPAGEKLFHIKMERLAAEMNVKRIYVSNVLNELQKQKLMHLERGRIYIPQLEKLIVNK
ncbi:Crp/Fnr family transcriptional regulator [Prevotella copri]|uniref:Crp/Fnr family transcriptional regulator n=1 Tax=Segatella copri TaxID=165179 RepID=A0A6G1TYC8_9BACT|nr:Crp/Fnr family transcriptional regulator [Segatella copri]MQN80314.1 Crp/Fnr family transcriptional regulator [Segatella copri]